MKNEQKQILNWAVNDVSDQKVRREIMHYVKNALTRNRQARDWILTLYQSGEHQNYVNAVNSIVVKDRVKTETMQGCRVCGTQHRDTYRCSFSKWKDDAGKDFFIGNVCAREHVGKYGSNLGVLTSVDEKSAKTKIKQTNSDLEELVAGEKKPPVLIATEAADRDERYVGSQIIWVLNQKKVPKKVLMAARKLHDSYERAGRAELKLVMEYIARHREFPAETYEPVVKDIQEMEKDKLAPRGLGERLRLATPMTGAKAQKLLSRTKQDYIDFRIGKNTEFLKQYEMPLAQIIDEIIPAVQHDQPLWHDDLVAQRYLFNKVLSADDYRLARKCLKRWAFGSTEALQGADRLRLRNIALRIEPVPDFKQSVDGLVVISRKLQYARDHLKDEEHQQLGRIKQAIETLPEKYRQPTFKKVADQIGDELSDPCRLLKTKCFTVESLPVNINTRIESVDRTYAFGDNLWQNYQAKLERAKEHVKYGIVSKDDLDLVLKFENRANTYLSIDNLAYGQQIRELQKGANSKLVVEMPFGADREKFAKADRLDIMAVRYMIGRVHDESTNNWNAMAVVAEKEYFTMKAKLYHNQLSEDKVLEMKKALNAKGVRDEDLLYGTQYKYICPVKVKDAFEKL